MHHRKIIEQIQEGIYPGASLALSFTARVSGDGALSGTSDPEKGESVVADLVYDFRLASVRSPGVATTPAFCMRKGARSDCPLKSDITCVCSMRRHHPGTIMRPYLVGSFYPQPGLIDAR